MAFKLTPEAQARIAENREQVERKKAHFANLSDENLIASTKLFMQHAEPKQFAPGEPIYDATLWHVILPELLRRLGERT